MLISRYVIQQEDYSLIEEFLENPLGPYSLRLQRIMNLFRGGGGLRLGVLCRKPFQEWVLVTLHGPNKPLEIHEEFVFTSLIDAEIEIFRQRWLYYTQKDPFKDVKNTRL